MGNRCVITDPERSIGIYLHWNGGIGSVEAFLTYCSLKGCRGFGQESSYAAARLCQVVGNFFGGTLSLGVSAYTTDEGMDPGDNGIFVVEGWKIIKHLRCIEVTDTQGNVTYEMQESDVASEKREYNLDEMLKAIDEKQPEGDRLGDLLDAETIKRADLRIGDIYYTKSIEEKPEKAICCGFGRGVVCGTDITGIPFGISDRWKEILGITDITLEAIAKAAENINCYVREQEVRVVRAKQE